MERGLLLPSIQVINSANGREVSYKVQYAPIYTGKAKSRPLSGYEEEIVKRALRSHSEGDNSATTPGGGGAAAAGYVEQIAVEGRAFDATNIDLMKFDASDFAITAGDIAGSSRLSEDSFGHPCGVDIDSTQLASRSLLGKRQHQVPPTILTSSGNHRASVSNRYRNMVNVGTEVVAPPVVIGKEASPSENSIHANGFKRPPMFDNIDEDLVETVSEDFIRLKLRQLKQAGSSKQRLREAAGGGDVAMHATSSQALQNAAVQMPQQQKARTQKEKAAELRRYQRRIIYMLNRVMTDAEAKQFEHFIKIHGLRPKEYPYE